MGLRVLAWKDAHRLVAGNEALQQRFGLFIQPDVFDPARLGGRQGQDLALYIDDLAPA